MIGVDLHQRRGPGCRLDKALRVAIPRPDGTVVSAIRGNPGASRIGDLAPGETLTGLWHWMNWCSADRRFVLTARLDGISVRNASGDVGPPICIAQGSASKITVVHEHSRAVGVITSGH